VSGITGQSERLAPPSPHWRNVRLPPAIGLLDSGSPNPATRGRAPSFSSGRIHRAEIAVGDRLGLGAPFRSRGSEVTTPARRQEADGFRFHESARQMMRWPWTRWSKAPVARVPAGIEIASGVRTGLITFPAPLCHRASHARDPKAMVSPLITRGWPASSIAPPCLQGPRRSWRAMRWTEDDWNGGSARLHPLPAGRNDDNVFRHFLGTIVCRPWHCGPATRRRRSRTLRPLCEYGFAVPFCLAGRSGSRFQAHWPLSRNVRRRKARAARSQPAIWRVLEREIAAMSEHGVPSYGKAKADAAGSTRWREALKPERRAGTRPRRIGGGNARSVIVNDDID